MSALTSLPGIGQVLEKRLAESGIVSAEQLCQAGATEAFLRLKAYYPDACLSSFYAIAGAVKGLPRGSLSAEEKAALKCFFRSL